MSASMFDMTSSPDPLNASLENSLPASARRVTRSQASQRFFSLESSPRKQKFMLDVGNETSPQKLLVTVEAEGDKTEQHINRRLFQSPIPKRVARRKERTTTTTVPLRGLSDHEDGSISVGSTPRRRGRLPQAGTPAPIQRRRPPTPRQGTPKQSRRTKAQKYGVFLSMGAEDMQTTPRSSARTRTTKRKTPTPANQEDVSLPRKRGRPKKSVSTNLTPQNPHEPLSGSAHTGIDTSIENIGETISVASSSMPIDSSDDETGDDDIWMAVMADPNKNSHHQPSAGNVAPSNLSLKGNSLPQSSVVGSEADVSENGVDLAIAVSSSEAGTVEEESHGETGKDTVIPDEEFTMISVGSLPSRQPNSSMVSAQQEEIGEETSRIINQTLESLRQTRSAQVDEVNGSSADQALREHFSASSSLDYGPRSRQQLLGSGSPPKNKSLPLGRQVALKSVQAGTRAVTAHLPNRMDLSGGVAGDQSAYEDSFSEIPYDVLEGATPKPVRRQPNVAPSHAVASDGEGQSATAHFSHRSASSKLLTPDETPSPEVDHQGPATDGNQSARRSPGPDEMRSSPPVFDTSAQESPKHISSHSRQDSSETPVAQKLLPELPGPRPDVGAGSQENATIQSGRRLSLSPIVRAGRALQLVTSDPPSPPRQNTALGSPFKRTSTRNTSPSDMPPSRSMPGIAPRPEEPSSPARQPSSEPRSENLPPLAPVRNLDLHGAHCSHQIINFPAKERPFSPLGKDESQLAEVEDGNIHVLDAETRQLGRNNSLTSSTRAEALNDDDMSWQADGSPARTTRTEMGGLEHSTVRGQRGSTEPPDICLDNMWDEHRSPAQATEASDGDGDLWAVEAQRPTPKVTRPSSPKQQAENPPRRSKLPSPWKKNSKRLLYSDELHKLSKASNLVSDDEMEEYSMLSLTSGNDDSRSSLPEPNQGIPKRVDFSSFFSSPATVPDVEFPVEDLTGAVAGRSEMSQTRSQLASFSGAIAKPSTDKTDVGQSPSVPQKAFHVGSQPRVDIFSPVKQPAMEQSKATEKERAADGGGEERMLSNVLQKMNFVPRLLPLSASLFFNPVQDARDDASSPAQEQTDPIVEAETQLQELSSSLESSFIRPQLRSLPDKTMSPSKSCLRSPLKPKTPGRVVEFANNVLSPLEQEHARVERRAVLHAGRQETDPQQQSSPAPVFLNFPDLDKENMSEFSKSSQLNTTASVLGSRPLQPRVTGQSLGSVLPSKRLSQTQWTKDHWKRLDQLLQQRRRGGTLQFQLLHTHSATATYKLRSAALLGKRVAAQGETMTLERWHLDVIDAFKAEVGGWEDGVLAKRLFALMVGEERRRKGLVPARRG
ncbi:hypothetical protein VTK73DRAFT_68 [Phialemonium thermophilum]|uniref:Uncharacterized protein n=1 Tax=Phialemonium thermophilum TaxID=223376 RepID=A0ABR3YA77_9PEZI